MYYNCGTAVAKRQTKQNSVSPFNVFAVASLQKLITISPDFLPFSLIILQFSDFSRFSRWVVILRGR